MVIILAAGASRPAGVASASQADPGVPPLPSSARFDAVLTRLFTPSSVPEGTYRVYVTPERVARVAAFFRAAPGASSSEAAWQIGELEPLTALGTAGVYDRTRVARLYVGQRVSVARGTVERGGRVTHSITLLSPHPNAALSALDGGTMIVVFKVPALS